MLTNPNTLGLFETQIEQIAEILHSVDALIYMDGANLNALLGIVQPGKIGFDVIHFNLHKTFSTPHGGGGPGAGPVGVAEKLIPISLYQWLPSRTECITLIILMKALPSQSAWLLWQFCRAGTRLYLYQNAGSQRPAQISENAIINANYLMAILKDYYHIQHLEPCMHEFVQMGLCRRKRMGYPLWISPKDFWTKAFMPNHIFPLIIPKQ
jgi:glycine dehydrogenase subunit 2